MKKLTMIVLTAAVALPLTFAADKPVTKAAADTNSTATTTTTTKTKKHHKKAVNAVKPVTPATSATPAPTK